MPAARRLKRAPLGQGLKRDLIQRTAFFILVFRVLGGLAAWLLFNELFLPVARDAWPVHVLFVCYFLVDAVVYFEYRDGQITTGIVLLDLLVNVTAMTVVAAYTGGLASPVVIIMLFKIAGYAFVFSPDVGVAAIMLTLAGFAALMIGEELGWLDLGRIEDVLSRETERRIDIAFRACMLGGVLVAAPWLFKQVADKEEQVDTEARKARDAAERERAAASVSSALLSVSEAISRLTRLDDILDKVVEIAPRVLGVDYCGIFLWNEDTGTYRGAAVSGVEPALAREITAMRLTPAEVPDLEWVRRLGHCALMAPRGIARFGAPESPALLTAPLLSGGRFYGVMQFARSRGKPSFVQRDLTTADGVASQTSVALERARLLEESRRFVRAIESTQEAVLITDRHRLVVFANQAFLRMFGYPHDEILGVDSLTLGGDLQRPWIDDVQRAVIESNWRGEATAQRKNGETFPVALHVSLIHTDDNRIEGAVAIMEDISTQKAMQQRMHRADRLAAAGELAAGVAHEVNNALSGILGEAEAVRDTDDAAELRAALGRVDIQGHRIAEIVRGLLGFARPQPPERKPLDLRGLVRETLALMAHELGRSRVQSETRFASELPVVLGDAKQLQQVLVNLLTNAMQAMEACGGGTLTISVQPDVAGVTLEVQDQGPGIAAEMLPRVFDPFFSTKEKGTGLGLSVSYAIVRAHGGDLTVRSILGEGTTFTLTLPKPAAETAVEARTVLLVDDDDGVAETLKAMLTREGLRVQRAASGSEALDVLARESFDAIFLDVRLPDISGPDVYARLAVERPEVARRVIFVTGGLWRIESRGLRDTLPAQPTLAKPCTAAQIREVLRLLRDTRAAA